MGNSMSPCFQPNPRSSVKLNFWEGNTRILTGKHIAGEPSTTTSCPGKRETYFVLPLDHFSSNVLSTSFVATLNPNPKSKPAPIKFGECPFEYVRGTDGRVLIKVLPEFITRLIHGSKEEGVGGNSFLCSTPELKKHYEMLVWSKEQVWSPKLETISEHKIRFSPRRFIGLEWK
ncbi:hypothetical protein F3Y22_tig00110295pilonHSYRG00023 [Hibiscus syriacus]|uniref:Uncharacterized protein n=1 Tax=Hibiscus syriacus TaxID=106335 RepID=A0A6A3B307_HIBSY|nr:hypothetical protein F3Y22_tig00110295pilonHSYRG00023 [Hibiscus syriacus]